MIAADDIADLRRWALSAAVVLSAHGAIAAAMVNWRATVAPAEPAAAIVVEFAPELVAPKTQETEIPPGPEQVMSEARIEQKPEPTPTEETPPEVKPAPNPELAMTPPQEVKEELPQREEPRAPAPVTSAPQAMPVETAAVAAAPLLGRVNPNNANAVPTWRTKVLALLERNKRYPPAAQSRREQGVAQVLFSLDRQGRVVDSRIVRSSGASALDAEALALLQRAQPFPVPPAELTGEPVNLTVPIRFNLK
jgi:protein TonB